MRIAISITTHNRYEVFKKTLANIKRFKPDNADIFIVDDGSTTPVKEATFRFDTPQGIAVAKNKCFELAEGYDYHFCFDDDCMPKRKDWHLPYINSGMNHLCFTFDQFSNGGWNGRVRLNQRYDLQLWQEPCGCMNFYTKACFDAVGGMDTDYGAWSYEHVSHSMRIHKAGLTPYPFMDIINSLDYFYSFDWDQTTKRSVDAEIRGRLAAINEVKYRSEIQSKEYLEFRTRKNLVLTTYFTTLVDPQRGVKWAYEPKQIDTLMKSIPTGVDFKVLCDVRNENKIMQSHKLKHENPYMAKWIAFRNYLNEHPEYDNVFLLDATDTEIYNNPFQRIEPNKLYVGDEESSLNNEWLKKHHPEYKGWCELNAGLKLLNAGVIGGSRDMVLAFLISMIMRIDSSCSHNLTDMGHFNYVLRNTFASSIEYGRRVTTVFKANTQKTGLVKSWIRHK